MRDAIIAGVISGLISPLILAWLSHKIIWKSQRRNEIRMNAFSDVITAFGLLETDAMDIELQTNKKEYRGFSRVTEFRPETIIAMGKASGMVKAFYSNDAFLKVDKTFKTKISLENIPNMEFYECRTEAVIAMAKELGINNIGSFKSITSALKRSLH